MSLNAKEKAELKESLDNMNRKEKASYIFLYYKWYIILGVIAIGILGNALYRTITKKDPLIYLGACNVAVGEDMEKALTEGFLPYIDANPKKTEVLPYYGIYLSDDPTAEDHQYAYASRMKVMAAVNAKKLDVVLMNREAYDLLSNSEYLLDLSSYTEFSDFLVENTVILETNAVEYQLNQADELHVVSETVENALNASTFPLMVDAGFSDDIYVGIIANTEHLENAIAYLTYLSEAIPE